MAYACTLLRRIAAVTDGERSPGRTPLSDTPNAEYAFSFYP